MYKINTKKDKPDTGKLHYTVEQMMRRGIRVAELDKLEKHYLELKDGIAANIYDKFGIKNPNSPKQVTDFIKSLSDRRTETSPGEANDILEICCIQDYKTKEYKWTSNSQALEKLAAIGYDFAADMIDYRIYKKYAESIASVKKFLDGNGLIHPSVNLTKTQRISYKDPALMNIPKALLWNIIAPLKDGDVLYSVDIKNQEPNILLNILQEEELMPALTSEEGLYEYMFKQVYKPEVTMNLLVDTFPDERIYSINELQEMGAVSPAYFMPVKPQSSNVYYNDSKIIEIETICQGYTPGCTIIYPETAKALTEDGEIVEIPIKWNTNTKISKTSDSVIVGELLGCDVRISKAERKEFKTSWLALTYGAAAISIKESCKLIDGGKLYKYFTHLPQMKIYRSNIDRLAKMGVQTINNIFGMPMYADKSTPKELKRSLLDLPIQGTGSAILSLLVEHFNNEMIERGLADKVFIYYTRHDEIIVEASEELVNSMGEKELESMLRDVTEHQVIHESSDGTQTTWVPFKVEINKIEQSEEINKELDIFDE